MAISQKSKASRFDLLEQLTFYGSYHNNKWNQARAFNVLKAWTQLAGQPTVTDTHLRCC